MLNIVVRGDDAVVDVREYLKSITTDNPKITIEEVNQRVREFLVFMNYQVEEVEEE